MNVNLHPAGPARGGLPAEPIVVLAYSGGLDTSIIVPWLRETYGARVVCVMVDVGQGDDPGRVREKALRLGAVACEVVDARDAFVSEYVWPTLRAGAVYARKYLLGTAMARPVTARSQVEVARALSADALAHGCTGKGNDQVRFELTYAAFAPNLPVIAPWREWSIRSREDAIEYARARGIPVEATTAKITSRDRNLWHCSHEGGPLEDPDFEPPDDLFLLSVAPEAAPDRPAVVTIGFEGGFPVSLDGERLAPVELLAALNALGGAHGVGRADLIEDRLVGMKSRGVYETPGGTILTAALRELETLVLDRRSLALKDGLAARYADLVYEGRWWSAERKAMDALVDSLLEPVTGDVRLKLYKGSVAISGRKSPHALYDAGLATFGASESYDHADAAGFIRLFGLPTRVEAVRDAAVGRPSRAGSAQEPAALNGA
ncbi:MAG: argininosuccinate synthase, partial [Gemmatimonadota bacterium]